MRLSEGRVGSRAKADATCLALSRPHSSERDRCGTGESRVLWQNEQYNALLRTCERESLRRFITALPENSVVLDIGWGVAVVSQMLIQIHNTAIIHAVGFAEMVSVAQQENPSPRIRYIESAAEDYLPPNQRYNAILSSACYSRFRDVAQLEKSLSNAAHRLANGSLRGEKLAEAFAEGERQRKLCGRGPKLPYLMSACGKKPVVSGVLP